ncbi:MAG: hypothetical protein PHU85_09070, partial [Phycisphaerae bacterium]|nr:hypothetical protein [Phycisphaerae bacterium]
ATSGLIATRKDNSDVDLNWVTNAATQSGSDLWGTSDGLKWTWIASLPAAACACTVTDSHADFTFYDVVAFGTLPGQTGIESADTALAHLPGDSPDATPTTKPSPAPMNDGGMTPAEKYAEEASQIKRPDARIGLDVNSVKAWGDYAERMRKWVQTQKKTWTDAAYEQILGGLGKLPEGTTQDQWSKQCRIIAAEYVDMYCAKAYASDCFGYLMYLQRDRRLKDPIAPDGVFKKKLQMQIVDPYNGGVPLDVDGDSPDCDLSAGWECYHWTRFTNDAMKRATARIIAAGMTPAFKAEHVGWVTFTGSIESPRKMLQTNWVALSREGCRTAEGPFQMRNTISLDPWAQVAPLAFTTSTHKIDWYSPDEKKMLKVMADLNFVMMSDPLTLTKKTSPAPYLDGYAECIYGGRGTCHRIVDKNEGLRYPFQADNFRFLVAINAPSPQP